MNSKPILFSAPMVRAILEGRKTQTRRIITPQPDAVETAHFASGERSGQPYQILRCYNSPVRFKPCASGWSLDCPGPFRVVAKPGSNLWVKETWRTLKAWDHVAPSSLPAYDDPVLLYDADGAIENPNGRVGAWGKTRVSIHMPRWASRITLEVVAVRVERLQDITEADANAEGCPLAAEDQNWTQCRDWYRQLWNQINGPGAWEQNPFVWVVEFKNAIAQATTPAPTNDDHGNKQ